MEKISGNLFAEKIKDKTKETKNALKLFRKNFSSPFETPTSLQKIAFPDVAKTESPSSK